MTGSPSVPPTRRLTLLARERGWEMLGCALILGLVFLFLGISWRKWPDPLIDFGRELYLPWRIAEGAVLYQDLDHWFGPLSQYLNAAVFFVAGPGFMHLVYVNLVLYLLILGLIYSLVRIAWGPLAAFAASSLFVCVFSFSQIVRVGNYNFVAPYAHETVHGILLLLAIVASVTRWCRSGRLLAAGAAGLFLGMTVLTKVEIIFSAACIAAVAAVLILAYRKDIPAKRLWVHMLVAIGCCVLPNLIAASALSLYDSVTLPEALKMTNRAWFALIEHREFVNNPLIQKWLGMDAPARNITGIGIWTLATIALLGCLAGASYLVARVKTASGRWAAALAVLAGVLIIAAQTDWPNAGQALPGMLLAGAGLAIASWWRNRPRSNLCLPVTVAGVLLWVLACSMLARMALNPRIYHYGFYQAALAGIVSVALIVAGVPAALGLAGFARRVYIAGALLLVGMGCIGVATVSSALLAQKTEPVGEGVDQLYGFAPEVNAKSKLLEVTRRAVARTPDVKTLLVAPEGVMLNYLVRVPSSVSDYVIYLPFLRGESARFMAELQANPPSHLALISRDLREYGINQFGDSPPHGRALLQYVADHYVGIAQLGGDPLSPNEVGMLLFRRDDAPAVETTMAPEQPADR